LHTTYTSTIQGRIGKVKAAGAKASIAAQWFQIWSPLAATKVTFSFGTFEMNSFMKSSWHAFPVVICFWQQYSDGVLLLLNFGPHVLETVYTSFEQCRSLAHIRQKIDKSTERNILFFLKPYLSCFLLFLSFPFTTKIIRFS
jgi:hypothetical protein